MVNRLVFCAVALLLLAGVARAETLQILDRRIAVDVVATSAMWGGLAGGAVGGAIAGVQMGAQNQGGYNWVPVIATGIGIGIAAGSVWGIVEAFSGPRSNLANGPTKDGMAMRDQRRSDLSGQVTIPLMAGRF